MRRNLDQVVDEGTWLADLDVIALSFLSNYSAARTGFHNLALDRPIHLAALPIPLYRSLYTILIPCTA